MYYKLNLSDNSYIITDKDYLLVLFKENNLSERISLSVGEVVARNLSGYVLCDMVNNKLVPIHFTIEPIENEDNLVLNTRIKNIENVQVGDYVLGPDGQPREVLELHTGTDEIYEIETEDGNKHRVNAGHILSLKDMETGELLSMPLNIYLMMDDAFKAKVKMWKI